MVAGGNLHGVCIKVMLPRYGGLTAGTVLATRLMVKIVEIRVAGANIIQVLQLAYQLTVRLMLLGIVVER